MVKSTICNSNLKNVSLYVCLKHLGHTWLSELLFKLDGWFLGRFLVFYFPLVHQLGYKRYFYIFPYRCFKILYYLSYISVFFTLFYYNQWILYNSLFPFVRHLLVFVLLIEHLQCLILHLDEFVQILILLLFCSCNV